VSATSSTSPTRLGAACLHAGGYRKRLLRGALLQASNPKSLLFFLSVLPQVAGAAGAAQQQVPLALAIATYCMVLVVIHGIYAGLAAKARAWLSRPGAARILSRLSALVFCAFGVTMLSSTGRRNRGR
jgi:threonine/homoserine/homoserine lactone efflux protein